MKKIALIVLLLGLRTTFAQFEELFDNPLFQPTDSLAARDELGKLHQSSSVNETDFAPRYWWRPLYWLEGKRDLVQQRAYVGAVQRDLTRLGYYCGPIDGIYS